VNGKKWIPKLKQQIQINPIVQSLGIYLDRLSKMIMVHSVRASLRRKVSPPWPLGPEPISSPYGPLFFVQGKAANEDVPQEILDRAVQTIKQNENAIEGRGFRFIFLPIPNKENIFYESLKTPKPMYLKRLIEALRREGVETIDTQKAFEEAYEKEGRLLYQTDDTHWNANGVMVTAELVKNWIENKE